MSFLVDFNLSGIRFYIVLEADPGFSIVGMLVATCTLYFNSPASLKKMRILIRLSGKLGLLV